MPRADRLAFVCPRFAEGPTVGGAETLLRNLARRAAAAGRRVTFLTTCARDHHTWANVLPPGQRDIEGMRVLFFPVDEDRDVAAFLRVQQAICARHAVSPAEQRQWLRNSVNSAPLCAYLSDHGAEYDRIVAGPYLFGLIYQAALLHPARTRLVPCLHDEPFAWLDAIRELFRAVGGHFFNSEPERELALRLYDLDPARCRVVGMGLDPFTCERPGYAAARGMTRPYVLYSGRREPLKGTPLLLDYLAAFRARTGLDIGVVLTGSGQVPAPPALDGHLLDLGFVDEDEKHDLMAGALAFCHPSANESLGIVVLESWLAGTPCLVSARGAVLTHLCRISGGGLWFRNYPDFEEALAALVRYPTLRSVLGAQGRRFVEREYTWERIDRRLFAALDGA